MRLAIVAVSEAHVCFHDGSFYFYVHLHIL